MGVLWIRNRPLPGLGCWTAGSFCYAFALPLALTQGHLEQRWLAYVLPNALMVLATMVFYVGSCRFVGVRVQWQWIAAWSVAFLPAFLYFLYFNDQLRLRIQLMSALMGFFFGITAWTLFQAKPAKLRLSARFCAFGFLLAAACFVFRMVVTGTAPSIRGNFDETLSNAFLQIVSVVMVYLWTLCTILMIHQYQHQKLADQLEAQLAMEEEMQQTRRQAETQRALRHRQLLVRDLHDGICGITANLALLATLGKEEEERSARRELLQHIEAMALEGNREIRMLMTTLENQDILWGDWLNELHHYARKTIPSTKIALLWRIQGELPDKPIADTSAATSLMRAIKESIHNLVRHSGASEASLLFRYEAHSLHIQVADNGIGMEIPPARGRGWNHMHRRIKELGGTLTTSGQPGVVHQFQLPLPLACREVDDLPSPEKPARTALA